MEGSQSMQTQKTVTTLGRCMLFSVFVFAAGCATVDRKVNVLYQPVVHGTGGSGDLYLAVTAGQAGLSKTTAVQWIVGKVKNTDGDKTGDIVTTTAPGDLVLDVFKQEFAVAGYKVIPVDALPQEVAKGLDVTGITVELEETASLIKSEEVCRLAVSVELWKNGRKFRKIDYKSTLSDFAIKDRDLLTPMLLQKSLQEVMKQAVPEIVKALES